MTGPISEIIAREHIADMMADADRDRRARADRISDPRPRLTSRAAAFARRRRVKPARDAPQPAAGGAVGR
jgi:hypothetical protein